MNHENFERFLLILVQKEKQMQMKSIFLIFFLILSGEFFAQQQAPVTNSQNNVQAPTLKKEALEDTLYLEPKVSKSSNLKDSESKKTSTRTKEKEKNILQESALQENSLKLDAVGTSFTKTKIASSTQTTQRSPSISQQNEMIQVINEYEKIAPNSFEFHYFKYVAGNYNVNLISHLKEAENLKPKNVDVQVQLAAYHFIKNEDKKLIQNLEFLLKSKRIEAELLIYADDLIESVSPNGTLITHGFDDTYSALYQQKVLKKRQDVKIISLDFMQSEYYRNSLQSENYKIPKNAIIDVLFLENFCVENEAKNLQLSMTFPKPYLKQISPQLKVLGLTFLYGNSPEKLMEKNEEIYEKINPSKINAFTSEKVKSLSSNYLPLLLSLKSQYENESKPEKVKEINTLIEKIKVQSKKGK
jgi:hypothetical protein